MPQLPNTHRWARGVRGQALVWLTIVMTLLSLTPAAVQSAAAEAQPAREDPPVLAQDPTTTSLEVHLVECPPGTTGSGLELFETCHANGLEGVGIQVTSTDPALGIDQAKTTVLVSEGFGVINTGDIPVGEYRVTVDLPADTNDFSLYCSGAQTDQEYTATPDPNDPASMTITLPGDEGVVCDWYVIPQGQTQPEQPQPEQARIDLSVYTCDETALAGAAGRAWEDLSPACAQPAQDITFNLTNLATNEVTTTPVDDAGQVSFPDLVPGDYTLYSDVPDEQSDEYLFCVADGGERYEKTFNENVVTTFQDLETEQIACDWFVVMLEAEPAPTATTAPTATVAPTPTEGLTQAPPTEAPVPTATAAPAEEAVQAQQDVDGSITATLYACPQGYSVEESGNDLATFQANCTGPVTDVVMTLTDAANGNTNALPTDASGTVSYPYLPPGTYTLYSSIPLEAATEHVFCTSQGVTAPQELSDRGVATFELGTEDVTCAWYVVPTDLRGQETGGSVTVHLAVCPQEYTGEQLFDDCHDNGVADQQFTLGGPAGELTATTELPQSPGPGITTFTELPAGDYTLSGGPPGDFGSVRLYCSDQATSERIDATIESTVATFSLGENQDVLCDWYYIPENASGITPTPTPAETPRAEILVTLYACAPTSAQSGYAGASYQQLRDACQTPVNDVTFTLGDVGAPPLSAATGVSGPGAVRFYDLLPADYTLTPSLPPDLTNAAVFCRIGDGDVYQKSLQSGATTFVDVAGEQISCEWFAAPVQPAPQPAGPTGSITVREYLCQKDRSEIQDWERECVPGSTGTSFTLTSADGAITLQATPDAQGVLVFSELPDGFYELTQDTGIWCRAAAERVDSRSRVIVRDGGNTDVFIYECGQVNTLPNTGSGSGREPGNVHENGLPAPTLAAALLALLAAPAFALGIAQARRPAITAVAAEESRPEPVRTRAGTHWIRFR